MISLAFIALYFAVSSAHGLNAYFTQDDAGNLLHMHRYWESSIGSVIGSALRVVTPTYRPLGGIYYLTLYRLAGFNPVPFRSVCLALMLVNLFLAFAVLRRLSGSVSEALLGTALIANHPALLWLFYSSGTIYEILCFLFYFLAVLCYFDWRQARQESGFTSLSWAQLAILMVLASCALDSKEMAMTLPAALFLIEVIYFPPESWDWRNATRLTVRQGRGVLATGALAIAVICVKTMTHNPLSDDPRYKVESLSAAFETMGAYQGHLLYRDLIAGGLPIRALLMLWLAMGLAAFALRSRPMTFGLGFLIVSLVPVCLIHPRGGYMLYLPLVGWALFIASLFRSLSRGLIRLGGFRPRASVVVQCLTFGAAIFLIVGVHATRCAPVAASVREEQTVIRRTIQELRERRPQLEPASSLLIVNDPLPPGFGLSFLTRLAYGDPAIDVDRSKTLEPIGEGAPAYDHVFFYEGGRLHEREKPRPIHVQFLPARARPGESYTVLISDFASQTLDVAVRVVHGVIAYAAVVRQWCQLDSLGRATLTVPSDFAPQLIRIRYMRTQEGDWISASGVLEVTR
jgi:hypothetical protein